MTKPLISVVIPCYNAEKWLPDCLQSLLDQTEQSWHAICVDDASTDNTLSVIEQFALADSRIQVLRHQENKGVSAARNTGLAHVKAKLVTFIDSDDWYAPTALASYIATQTETNADLVYIASRSTDLMGKPTSKKRQKPKPFIIDFDKVADYEKGVNYGGGVVWTKCFRMEIIQRENLRFHEDLTLAEDNLFCWEYFFQCRRIAGGFSEQAEIFHRKREDSLYNRQKCEFRLEQIKLVLPRIYALLEKHEISDAPSLFNFAIIYFRNIKHLRDVRLQKAFLHEIRDSASLYRFLVIPILRRGNWRRRFLLPGLLRGWTELFCFWRSSRKK